MERPETDVNSGSHGNKRLRVDYRKCTGCHLCEITCSLFNEQVCNPTLSRICVVSWEDAFDVPLVCHQCDDAPCSTVCPAQARQCNERTGAIEVDLTRCIGCHMCVYECPFGAILVRKEDGKTTNCVLCEGDPRCVKVCDTGALAFIPLSETEVALSLFESTREKVKELKTKLE